MDTMDISKKRIFQGLFVLVIILSVYYGIKAISEIKQISLLGGSTQPATISFSGHGEVKAVPDIANVYFTISKDSSTVKDAQAGVATIEKSALDILKTKGVADADIQTADASFNPKYEYRQTLCPTPAPAPMNSSGTSSTASPAYCGGGKQVQVGYTASESITVKVRATDTIGDIMQALGTTGITNLSGPNFTIDNQDALQVQARQKAIDDAKAKAKVLAKELGVSLGKISSFSDTNGGYPMPYAMDAKVMSVGATAPTAAIPKGENTISSDVTITYEIK